MAQGVRSVQDKPVSSRELAFPLDARGVFMACGGWKTVPTGHLDFEGLTLAGVGPLAFQGPTAAA